jgi:hypothetical protein
MRKKSATSKIVRRKAVDIRPATEADLARLSQAMEGPIDTSDIPEQRVAFRRLTRDSTGRLPTRKSVIRDAIVRELEHLNMTPYRLWKEAKVYCPTLSQSAVHEFIKGQRQLELPYAEALMAAVHLGIARNEPREKQPSAISSSAGSKVTAKRGLNRRGV